MIENEFYADEFEQLLKEKADQFSMYPSKRVWYSIYNNLHPSRRWPSVVVSLLLLTSLMLIGYLHTGDNSITGQINLNNNTLNKTSDKINKTQNLSHVKQTAAYSRTEQKPVSAYNHAFADLLTNESDYYTYTVVKSNRPTYLNTPATTSDNKLTAEVPETNNTTKDIVQVIDTYIKTNQIFTDIAAYNKKNNYPSLKSASKKAPNGIINEQNAENLNSTDNTSVSTKVPGNTDNTEVNKPAENIASAFTNAGQEKHTLTNEDKDWIENYALQNKPAAKRWKGRLGYQFYFTPAVNYRKLTTESKGSATPFATGDINRSISQKPGVGIEAGIGLNYAIAKRLQLKAGIQVNYTNYNISADENSHPVSTTILLNDPATGYSYSAARTSTKSNAYYATALQPVTLHNRTYQISIPVGFGYKLSSQNNVDWYAGATVQPSYIFGGNAHLISTDLKSYVSEPSSIKTWNLNLGFETYMNFKLGTYNLQVGPQVRYQVYSTYKKDVALIEKPYAIGLKFGLTKGF